MRHLTFSLATGIIFCCLNASVAVGQEYPNKSIRFVTANSPGTVMDSMGRTVAIEMSKLLGQPIIVENKPSADSIIAYEHVAKQVPADGYTLALVNVPSLAILPLIVQNLRFDPLRDLPPIVGLVETRLLFGSASKQPWKTFNEMVAYARANPGKLNYGASGPQVRLPTEAIIRQLGLRVIHVPYKAGATYFQGLVSGEVHIGFLAEATVNSFGDKFRVLAVTGEQRLATFRDVPTFAELGIPHLRNVSLSLNARAGTPKPVIDKVFLAASQALLQPDLRERFAKLHLEIVSETPGVAAGRLAEEAKIYAEIAKAVGIQPE